MASWDDYLVERTYKDVTDTQRRVFYTLIDSKHLEPVEISARTAWVTAHRSAKLLSQLVAKLEEQGSLSGAELDELLVNVTR